MSVNFYTTTDGRAEQSSIIADSQAEASYFVLMPFITRFKNPGKTNGNEWS